MRYYYTYRWKYFQSHLPHKNVIYLCDVYGDRNFEKNFELFSGVHFLLLIDLAKQKALINVI